VYHDLLTQRSEFFRAARSQRWSDDPTKPTTLDDVEVEVFSAYLHCVNFGAEALNSLVQAMMEDHPKYLKELKDNGDSGSNDNGKDNDDKSVAIEIDDPSPGAAEADRVDTSGVERSTWEASDFEGMEVEKFLIDLYLLADKLIDPVAADLMIDKLTSVLIELKDYLPGPLVGFAYASTTEASPLRRLLRDYSMIDDMAMPTCVECYPEHKYPYEFIKDILLRHWAINRISAEERVRKVYCGRGLHSSCYHQVVDKDSVPSAGAPKKRSKGDQSK
jgi:hypothetical protein